MRSRHLCHAAGILCLAALALAATAAAPPSLRKARDGKRADNVAALAIVIDRHIDAELKKNAVVAAPLADDHEFVRRVYLDVAGRIPRVSEVRAFVEDKSTDKRRKLVEKLLDGPNYITHFTNVWRTLLLPQNNNQQVQFLATQMETWVRSQVENNTPYDKMVRQLITTQIGSTQMGRVYSQQAGNTTAYPFFQANEMKADNIAAAVSRTFLGVKIECAQCHDHPFADWKRKQFWEFAAFFGGIKPANAQAGIFGGATDNPKVHEIEGPNSGKMIQAKFLDGKEPKWQEDSFSRVVLAEWMTAKDNPFFARAGVNRLWEHFFGIGLVDPVDDMRKDNPASHPKLLDDLAKAFADHDYDQKFIIRAITASKAYQRSAAMTDRSQDNLRLFARMPLKGLTPEQIFDSLATAVGYRGDATGQQFRFVGFGNNTPRGEILTKFANPVDRKTEWQTSILQALSLMNGKFISDATSLDRSETLAAVIDSPFMNTKQKLDTLFLSAFGRPMRSSEASRLTVYVNSGGPSRDKKKALADVFWVLLNSSEFILNH